MSQDDDRDMHEPRDDGGPWLQRPWADAAPKSDSIEEHIPAMIKNHKPQLISTPPPDIRDPVERAAFERAWLSAQFDAARKQGISFDKLVTKKSGPGKKSGPEPQ